MIEKIVTEKIKDVERFRKVIESKVDVKLKFDEKNKSIKISGDSLGILTVKEFIKALEDGFDPSDAIKIVTENFIEQEIDIREYAGKKKSHRERVLARIIGRNGSAKRTIEEMTKTKIIINERKIYVLGYPEDVSLAIEAIENILEGRKHSTAYRKIQRKARWRKLERKYQIII